MPGNYSALGNGGAAPTKTIINAFSSGGVSTANLAASSLTNMAKEYLSGALSAGVLSGAIVTITGPGHAPYLVAYSKDATARTIRLQVVVDGVTVFDATSNSISASGTGVVAVGHGAATAVGPSCAIRWQSSLVVKVASSLGETDKIGVAISAT